MVTNNTSINTTDYLDGFQYLKTGSAGVVKLQFFPTAEGYVSNTVVSGANVYKYVYNYTDHLGNNRLSYSKNNTTTAILEENNYYPFGLKHNNYNLNKAYFDACATEADLCFNAVNNVPWAYRFNNKEFQGELGLNVTAMDYRQYDNAIGRFNSIDALSELDPDKSPFAFARNSPVVLNDPSGLSPESDWDNYAKNDELDQNLYIDHPPGFDGEDLNQLYITSGTPMGGTLVSAFVYGSDKNRADESYSYDNGRYEGQEGFDNDYDFFDNYYSSGEYGPYIPDAISFGYSGGVNGFFFSADASVSLAITNNDIALVIGGGISSGPQGGMPGLHHGGSIGLHDKMGTNDDVLEGLGGNDKGYFGGIGIGGSMSKSLDHQGNIDLNGVSTTTINIGPTFGCGTTQSTAKSFQLSNGINYLKGL